MRYDDKVFTLLLVIYKKDYVEWVSVLCENESQRTLDFLLLLRKDDDCLIVGLETSLGQSIDAEWSSVLKS